MKLHHAATFALVGWYLMVPGYRYDARSEHWQLCCEKKFGMSSQHYFPSYQILGSYDSAKECETDREAIAFRVPDDVKKDRQGYAELLPQAKALATYIASDDPRLK
jgi:hypothetical protein